MGLCVRALLLALGLIPGTTVLVEHSSFHVGMSKLSAVAAFVSMVAFKETATAEKVEEGGQVEDKTQHAVETKEGQLQDDVSKGAEDGEALLEEAEEDEEGGHEDESMDEEDEEGEEDDEFEIPKPQDVMEDLDTNNDKKLSLAELMTENIPKEIEESLPQAFDRFDRNKDNNIDSDELPALVEELHNKTFPGLDKEDVEDEGEEETPENPAHVMRDLDIDKDGALSFTELVSEEDEANLIEEDSRSIKELFEESDKNKDGKLDMQELPAALEEMDKRDL